jgi:hypothetical protein
MKQDNFQSNINNIRAFPWKVGITAAAILTLPALLQIQNTVLEYVYYRASIKLWGAIIGWLILLAGLLCLTWIKQIPFLIRHQEQKFIGFLKKAKSVDVLFLICTISGFLFLIHGNREYSLVISVFWVRLFLLWVTILFAGWFLHFTSQWSVWRCYSLIGIAFGIFWQVLTYIPYPINYPFSLNWSETSWYYYASFFFSRKLYGNSIPWPFLDIGRPILLSLVYFISNPPLWLIRVWQSVLWLGLPLLVTWLLYRRIKPSGITAILLIAWGFLWMLLGPVYYHLCIAVAIILWGFDRTQFWKTIVWVGIASAWAGILRINWLPVPAMLTVSLYLLETPVPEPNKFINYLREPFFYGLDGLLTGIAAFLMYLSVSGQISTRLGTKFSSPFLTYRLWPNATLVTGILPGILVVSGALLIILILSWRKRKYHPMRLGLLTGMLAILFVGGLVASIRIGGGGNLHNLDAYLTLLMIWGAYAITDSIKAEQMDGILQFSEPLLMVLWLTPVIWTLLFIPSFLHIRIDWANSELGTLKGMVQKTSLNGARVLFINQRQLLTFGYINNVPLESEYELEELSEMADAGNNEYFISFYNELRVHKYGLIVMDNNQSTLQSRNRPFSEENNAWVKYVLLPVLSHYHLIVSLPQSGVNIYAPNP